MTVELVRAIFLLAGIPVKSLHELANQYWPDVPDYADIRRLSPWYLVETEHGLVRIGWRKRVISISWESTPVRAEVTSDEVTKDKQMVHAWGYHKAVQYLTSWRVLAEECQAKQRKEALAHEL